MDNERQLKIELGRALDEVLPPAPWLEAVVAEDLRARRSRRSLDRRPGTQPRSKWSFRPAIQLVAGVLVLALAAATVVTFLTVRNRGPQSAPAGPVSVEAYQKVVSHDDGMLIVARGDSCLTLQSICPPPGRPVQTALQRWLDDLNRSEPPARFAVIDAQMRRHLAANISEINVLFAAYQAQDQNGLDRANQANSDQQHWIGNVASSIADSRPGTAVAYISSVRAAYQDFGGCAACQSLIALVDCAEIRATSCEYAVIYATHSIEPFQSALVRVTAPSSLAAQDQRLQIDLAQADTGVFTMSTAQVTGDQAGFNAGRLLVQQALPAIKADVVAILGA